MPQGSEIPASAAISTPFSVALDRYFEIALYLMLLTGFGALASTGGLDLIGTFLVSSALLLRGYLLLRQQPVLIPDRWTTLFTLAYTLFYLADYALISRSFLNATVHLVLFVMVVRMFSARRERDNYFLATLAFLMVLAASVLTVDSLFLLAFGLFMVAAVATFILMEMRHSSARATLQLSTKASAGMARRLAASIAGTAPLIVLQILVGTAIIFFVLPRVSAGYLSAYSFRNELATGFSDRVELGQIGQIQQSNAVVMHIHIDGDEHGAFNLKFQGVTLNIFDGRVWSDSHAPHLAVRLADGRFSLFSPTEARPELLRTADHPGLHYRVLMEPLGTNVFFLASRAISLAGNYRLITLSNAGTVLDLDAQHPVESYEGWSDISRPSAAALRAASGPYPRGFAVEYLQLPRLDPRIAPLAASITAGARNNYDKAAAIENYLLTHFSYTLQLSRTRPSDPVAEFLFTRKQGHCEYFASSMAVLLRTSGIPSRVVNGFRLNEFNDLTSQYVVRDSDAHSWVEAYFPGYGWVSFDPTPASPGQPHTAWGRIMLYMDAMQSFWREWVIEYNASQQVELGAQAITSSRRTYFRSRQWLRRHYQQLLAGARSFSKRATSSPIRWLKIGFGCLFVTAVFLTGPRLWQRFRELRLAAHPDKAPSSAAELWYRRMAQTLARKGWPKMSTQTPVEFARRIENDQVRELVIRFTLHYHWARFGQSAKDAGMLPVLYDEVLAATRRWKTIPTRS